jgi:hypothetical protein
MQRVTAFVTPSQLGISGTVHGLVADGTVVFGTRDASLFVFGVLLRGGGGGFACGAGVGITDSCVSDRVRCEGCFGEYRLELGR